MKQKKIESGNDTLSQYATNKIYT